jgi:hypothetical protein
MQYFAERRCTTSVLRFGSVPGAERNVIVTRLYTELFEAYLKGTSNDAQSSPTAGISTGAADSLAASEARSGSYPSFPKITGMRNGPGSNEAGTILLLRAQRYPEYMSLRCRCTRGALQLFCNLRNTGLLFRK